MTTVFARPGISASAPRICQRKPHLKPCIARFRMDLDIAAMFPHDPLHRIESQSRALAHTLGRKEGFKNVCSYFRRDSGAIIADLNDNAAVVTIRSEAKLALAIHSVNRRSEERRVG